MIGSIIRHNQVIQVCCTGLDDIKKHMLRPNVLSSSCRCLPEERTEEELRGQKRGGEGGDRERKGWEGWREERETDHCGISVS